MKAHYVDTNTRKESPKLSQESDYFGFKICNNACRFGGRTNVSNLSSEESLLGDDELEDMLAYVGVHSGQRIIQEVCVCITVYSTS